VRPAAITSITVSRLTKVRGLAAEAVFLQEEAFMTRPDVVFARYGFHAGASGVADCGRAHPGQ
jgi:hypothetical protein